MSIFVFPKRTDYGHMLNFVSHILRNFSEKTRWATQSHWRRIKLKLAFGIGLKVWGQTVSALKLLFNTASVKTVYGYLIMYSRLFVIMWSLLITIWSAAMPAQNIGRQWKLHRSVLVTRRGFLQKSTVLTAKSQKSKNKWAYLYFQNAQNIQYANLRIAYIT